MKEQNFSNHTKFFPAFHFFVVPVLLLNFGWSVGRWVHSGFSVGGFVDILTAAALFILAFCARIFALKVQDRVIRLEERLRCERVLPNDLRGRIGELTVEQLVGLRFAGDEELPELARQVLDGKIRGRRAIKKQVKNWRADYLRA